MLLHELSIGDNGFIEKITSQNALRERMLALGLTKGTKVSAIRKGPAGDPTIYYIRGAMIALRKEEASLIHILKQPREEKSSLTEEANETVQMASTNKFLED